jgi:hypothetical protein
MALQPNVPTTPSRCHWDKPQCVEVTLREDGMVEVADTKQGFDSPVLVFTRGEWDAFIRDAKDGTFDIERGPGTHTSYQFIPGEPLAV